MFRDSIRISGKFLPVTPGLKAVPAWPRTRRPAAGGARTPPAARCRAGPRAAGTAPGGSPRAGRRMPRCRPPRWPGTWTRRPGRTAGAAAPPGGVISLAKAKITAEATAVPDDARAAAAETLIAGQLAGKTPGQVAAL